jgi:hypothetical protein
MKSSVLYGDPYWTIYKPFSARFEETGLLSSEFVR